VRWTGQPHRSARRDRRHPTVPVVQNGPFLDRPAPTSDTPRKVGPKPKSRSPQRTSRLSVSSGSMGLCRQASPQRVLRDWHPDIPRGLTEPEWVAEWAKCGWVPEWAPPYGGSRCIVGDAGRWSAQCGKLNVSRPPRFTEAKSEGVVRAGR